MLKVEIYEEVNCWLHKILGAYAALYAWCSGVDVIVISRESLMSSFQVKALHRSRVDQFLSDNRNLFAYSELIGTGQQIQGVVMARREVPKKGGWLGDSTQGAADVLVKEGVSTVVASLPAERTAVEVLALLSYGLEDFEVSVTLKR